ncbi:MAG TPA: M24 family metallopeptidase [Solirubrobacteraceae bacterium]|nr:M24 family metallopeptidase [Solirubrobacteraceae bacterium]
MTFAPAEHEARLRRVRERMAAQGIDTLIVSDPANMHYLTGYDGWSFYTPQGVVVPADGDVLLFTRRMDTAGARITTSLADEQILGFADDYVQQRDRHPLEWVAGELLRRGAVGATVALEMDAYYFTPRAFQALRSSLPEARFVDSHELVNWVRAVKSTAELELMRTAARIVERVMAAGIEAVEPGVRQCDAVAAIYDAALRGADGAGGDYPAIVPMLPTGPAAATPHLTWSEEPFKAGEATLLELAGCHRRYHCPMARTVFLGRPPRRILDTAAATRDGLEAALAAVQPGARCEDVEAAWRLEIARHGLEKESRIGYSVGLNYPPDWGEHTMSLRSGDTTELQPGMTFHMIVGMWMDGWGYELSETFHVAADGAECLSSFPRELAVKE